MVDISLLTDDLSRSGQSSRQFGRPYHSLRMADRAYLSVSLVFLLDPKPLDLELEEINVS